MGRLIFLGTPSPWLAEILRELQNTGSFEIQYFPVLSDFLSTAVPRNRVSVVVCENNLTSRDILGELKTSRKNTISIWLGKSVSKEDAMYALENRVYALIENPSATSPQTLETFHRAVERADHLERAEDLVFSLKTVLLQVGEEGATERLLSEFKTGLGKFQRHAVRSEYVPGLEHGTGGETRLPFYKSQPLADALLTIDDLARTGTLTVRSASAGKSLGQIDFLQGRPVSAVSGETLGLKAIYRMFLWDELDFEFKHQDPSAMLVRDQFALNLREICAEGEALRSRFEKVRKNLPPHDLRLELVPSALRTGTSLDRPHFSTLSSVVELGKVSQILDYNPLPDAVLYECLIRLKKSGMIQVQPSR